MSDATHTEATADELPRVLVKPSWLDPPKKVAPPVIEGLETFAFEERLVLTPEQAVKWREPSMSTRDLRTYLMRDPPPEGSPQSLIDQYVLSKLPRGMRYLSAWLEVMSDAAALEWIRTNDIAIGYPDASDLKCLLARFGLDVLPAVLQLAEKEPVTASSALACVESPRVARFIVAMLSRNRRAALPEVTAYFERFPQASAIGLIPIALSKKGQKAALPALQLLASGERNAIVRAEAARHGDAAARAVDTLLGWDLSPKKPPVIPAWFAPESLPPILLRASGHRLPTSAIVHVGTLLGMSDAREADERLDEVKAACTPDSLASFAWELFQMWLANGADAKCDWAMIGLGHLAGDDAARRLAPLIRAWPGESAHARAVKGLDVLARIGSDLSLMLLDGIAEKVKFKALQERARQKIEEVAQDRGLTRDELADRIAPTLELSADGSRVLSFGPRAFRVGFDEHLVPFVTDADGKKLSDLPKPKVSDDSEAATLATQTWKTLKKDAKTVASGQIRRLERAMCTQRRWTANELRTLLIDHPLVFHLVRRLLWGTFEGPRISALFRVAEDRTLADVEEQPFHLKPDATVGLVHRLEADDGELRRWGQIFADYELVQPFPQIGRDTYALTEAERAATSLARTKGVVVPTTKVLGLEHHGWRKGAPQDGGCICEMRKSFGGDLHVELPLETGIFAGAFSDTDPTQTLGELVVRRGDDWNAPALALGELSPLVASELLRDLEGLR